MTTQPPIRIDATHPTVAALLSYQGESSDEQFARQHLTVSSTAWGRVKAGKYNAADHSRILHRLTDSLDTLSVRGRPSDILSIGPLRATSAAVASAWGQTRDRLVVLLAPTGGGKTTVARALGHAYLDRSLTVESSEPWRTSYLAPLHAMLAALGIDPAPYTSARAAERILIKALTDSPKLIIIDEAHYFGPGTIHVVKAILNQTACTVLILAIPAMWARLSRAAWEESAQLRSRTAAVITASHIRRDDLLAYLADRIPGWPALSAADQGIALDAVHQASERFGLWATAARVVAEILAETSDSEPFSLDAIRAALRAVATLRP
jgi:type II secretory pathway predicted ATPase ExeA